VNSARSPREARRQAHVAILEELEGPSLEDDVRRVVPVWGELLDLVEGARRRGWSDDQIDYLTAVIGVTWAKAWRRGQADR